MFKLPAIGDTSNIPIQTLLSANDLFNSLLAVKDREAIWDLWLPDKLALVELADRFDCEVIGKSAKRLLEYHYDKSTAMELLIEASNSNSIPTAKIAIIKMGADRLHLDYTERGDWMEILRVGWQTELTRLLWKDQRADVKQPRKRKPKGRLEPLQWVKVRTDISFEKIAAAFRPKSDVSQYHRAKLMFRISRRWMRSAQSGLSSMIRQFDFHEYTSAVRCNVHVTLRQARSYPSTVHVPTSCVFPHAFLDRLLLLGPSFPALPDLLTGA